MEASYVDLADPTHLEFDYLRWIRIVLNVAGARRVLHIGGGACALARALAAQDPGGRQEVCEADRRRARAGASPHGTAPRARTPCPPCGGTRVHRGPAGRPLGRGRDRCVRRRSRAAAADHRRGVRRDRARPRRWRSSTSSITARPVMCGWSPPGSRPRTHRCGRSAPAAGNSIVAGSSTTQPLTLVASRAAADRSPARLTTPATLTTLLGGVTALHDADLDHAVAPFRLAASARLTGGRQRANSSRRSAICSALARIPVTPSVRRAMDPDRPDPRRAGARDVTTEIVADHRRLVAGRRRARAARARTSPATACRPRPSRSRRSRRTGRRSGLRELGSL